MSTLKDKISLDIDNMKALRDISLSALTLFDDGEITQRQALNYWRNGNITFKAIKAKFDMEQALITQDDDTSK